MANMGRLKSVTREFIKKQTGRYPHETKREFEQAKKDLEVFRRMEVKIEVGHALFEQEKKHLKSGLLKAERLFNEICDRQPSYPYSKIQDICCKNLGMRKRSFAEYKRRRKRKRKDFRDEPLAAPKDKQKLISYLQDCDGFPAVEDVPRILHFSEKRAHVIIQNLLKSHKITIRRRRFQDGKQRDAVVLRV